MPDRDVKAKSKKKSTPLLGDIDEYIVRKDVLYQYWYCLCSWDFGV